MKIAICDDEQPIRDYLKTLLQTDTGMCGNIFGQASYIRENRNFYGWKCLVRKRYAGGI